MLNEDERLISSVAAERSHRFLGLVKPDPSANRIVRRAWAIAERLGGELDLLWVTPRDPADDADAKGGVDELRRLAAVFGARLIVETDPSVARAVARVAAQRQSTYIIMGTPHLRRRLGRPAPSLVDEIVADDPSLDIVLVGDPNQVFAAP
jgi:two-component system sensor histidine kinase KdpD